MSKELVISAASHERRVAILEEGQLVEIYIEREKEFALVGSIYKGKVTRVLPGMQSAFVDIGLDGDAFLYVSDVFENLEDYDHGHPSESLPAAPSQQPPAESTVELLPGESLARVHEHHAEHHEEHRPEQHEDESQPAHHGEDSLHEEQHSHEAAPDEHAELAEEHHEAAQASIHDEERGEPAEEPQPESNASAPQSYAPQYNPTQNYPARSSDDRQRQNYGRGQDRGGERGGDRGRGRWGRRGGRRRGGRPQGGPGGRNLPPSKYASPQGSDSRGYENRSGSSRGYDNRRQEQHRGGGASSSEATDEPVLLPGESLAKYRAKPQAAPAPAPFVEHEPQPERPEGEEVPARVASSVPATGPGGAGVPRRFSGGLPRWLLADAGTEAEAGAGPAEEAAASESPAVEAAPQRNNDLDLNEDQVAALSSGIVEAKHEETQEEAEADAIVGGAEFEEEAAEESAEEEAEEAHENHAAETSSLSEEDVEEVEAGSAASRADFVADAAHESAEHAAALGEHEEAECEPAEGEHVELGHVEEEVIAAAAGQPVAEAATVEEDVILLPG